MIFELITAACLAMTLFGKIDFTNKVVELVKLKKELKEKDKKISDLTKKDSFLENLNNNNHDKSKDEWPKAVNVF